MTEGPPPGFIWSLGHLLDREIDRVWYHVLCTTLSESCSCFQPLLVFSWHLYCASSGERMAEQGTKPWSMTVMFLCVVSAVTGALRGLRPGARQS